MILVDRGPRIGIRNNVVVSYEFEWLLDRCSLRQQEQFILNCESMYLALMMCGSSQLQCESSQVSSSDFHMKPSIWFPCSFLAYYLLDLELRRLEICGLNQCGLGMSGLNPSELNARGPTRRLRS